MPHLIFDPDTRRCTGTLDGSAEHFNGGTLVPVDAIPADLSALVLNAQGEAVQDIALALQLAKTARIAQIKAEAADAITSTDWQLQRVREREAAGWATLSDVDVVLAKREAIRRSSNAAEAAVNACTTAQEVQALQWSATDVTVPLPCRVTRAGFLDALRAQGEDVIPAILIAKDSNPALLQWWTYFDQAEYIAGNDARLAGGLQGLEFAGLLPKGGAAAVLARVDGSAG